MNKLKSVQILRALAAILVTIAHASEEAKFFFNFSPPVDTVPFGKGVDLFFVISGFIIYYSSRGIFGKASSIGEFAYNRFSRVVPMYYLFTTLMVLVVVFLPSGVKEAKLDLPQIISSYAFFPYERYDGRIAPILSLGWTLNYEIFFYALFSLVIWLPARRAAVAMISILSALVFCGLFLDASSSAALRAWTDNIILEFALGIVIALAYDRYGKSLARSGLLSVAVAAVGFALLYVLNLPGIFAEKPPRILTAGLPAALVMFSAVMLLPQAIEDRLPSWLSALGDSSYSLYLSHRFVQRPLQILINRSGLDPVVAGPLYLLGAVLAAIAAGHIIYMIIETPLLRSLRALKGRVLKREDAKMNEPTKPKAKV